MPDHGLLVSVSGLRSTLGSTRQSAIIPPSMTMSVPVMNADVVRREVGGEARDVLRRARHGRPAVG